MFKNYIKVAVRNTLKHRGYSFINVTGLAIGMACCVVLFLYIQNELSYDRFHENSDRIYRVITQSESNGQVKRFATTSAPLGPALQSDFPEVRQTARIGNNVFKILYQGRRYYERLFYADPQIFDVFSFPLIAGDSRTALSQPHSLVISEKAAKKYFGDDDPVGKILNIENWNDFRITGVMRDIPSNSHLQFDFLAHFTDFVSRNLRQWGVSNYYTYALLSKGFSPSEFERKIPDFVEKYRGKEIRDVYRVRYVLQALTRIHLHSHLLLEISPNNDINNVAVFVLVAVLILLIACFNYLNLSTARYTLRAKEIGMRKVIGAKRIQIISQFMGETLILSWIAVCLALVLIELFLPVFNSIAGSELKAGYFQNPVLILFLIGIVLLVNLISGIYPAHKISTFQPTRALKGNIREGVKTPTMRKILVVGQFAVSGIFLITTAVLFRQLNYVKNAELGFDKEHVVMIPIKEVEILKKRKILKQEFLKNPGVLSACASSFFPGRKMWYQSYWYEGAQDRGGMIHWIAVDPDFLETFGIELLSGRNFAEDLPADSHGANLINEAAAKKIGWALPIGKQFEIIGIGKGSIIGVVKDFHFFSLHQQIEPLALAIYPEGYEFFSVRIRPDSVSKTLAYLGDTWKKFAEEQPFEYSFLDQDYDKLYVTESRLVKIFGSTVLLSVLIACLGLFGLASFTIERRTKEIGIRKVLGAPVANLFLLLSKEFAYCVLTANLISWPVGYFFMTRWLRNFAYRTDIGLFPFLQAAFLALVIGLFTISYQTIKTALANPAEVLRYE
jgi:putative ABC transport system permease protein